jgi:hypothetical protein
MSEKAQCLLSVLILSLRFLTLYIKEPGHCLLTFIIYDQRFAVILFSTVCPFPFSFCLLLLIKFCILLDLSNFQIGVIFFYLPFEKTSFNLSCSADLIEMNSLISFSSSQKGIERDIFTVYTFPLSIELRFYIFFQVVKSAFHRLLALIVSDKKFMSNLELFL